MATSRPVDLSAAVGYPALDMNAPAPVIPMQQEDDLVRLYKLPRTTDARRQNLLSIMDEDSIQTLREIYLKQLENRLAEMDAMHHPAVQPARVIIAEIESRKVTTEKGFEIIHQMIDLTTTPTDNPLFQTKSDAFLKSTDAMQKGAKSSYMTAACHIFLAALSIAGVVTLGVLAAPALALVSLSTAIGCGIGLGLQSAFATFIGVANIRAGHAQKSMADKMRLFSTAMQPAPAEPAAEPAPTPKV